MTKPPQSTALALAAVEEAAKGLALNPGALTVIRDTVAPDLDDMQLALFLHHCARKGLDPLAGQAFAFADKKGRMTIGSRIDGMRAQADKSKRYLPGPTRYEYDEKSRKLTVAHVKVLRWDDHTEQWAEIEESAYWEEFAQNKETWNTMPRVMLAKCAEARALRRAFPAELGGIYEPSELEGRPDFGGPSGAPPVAPQGRVVNTTAEPVSPAPAAPPRDVAYRRAYAAARKVDGATDKLISATARTAVELKALPPLAKWAPAHEKAFIGLVVAAVKERAAAGTTAAPPPGPDGAAAAGESLASSFPVGDHAAQVAGYADRLSLPPSAVDDAAKAAGAPTDRKEWTAETTAAVCDELERVAQVPG